MFRFIVLLFIWAVIAPNTAFAQQQVIQETIMEETITGTLEKRPWSKSTQSYCAQGSDYYCLVAEGSGEEFVLEILTKQAMTPFVGQRVTVKGIMRTKTITNKADKDPQEISQRPVSYDPITGENVEEDFTCTVFVMQNIRLRR